MSATAPDQPTQTTPRRGHGALWVVFALAIIVSVALLVWNAWPKPIVNPTGQADLSPEALDARLLQAEAAIVSLQRSQNALNQRQTEASARTGLLREEILGVTQRSALLEDSVRKLSSSRPGGETALRLDEAELLLTMAAERLRLANDLPGAIRATELADGVLSSLSDPALLNIRQTLAQELAAARALPKDPQAIAAGELDALEAVLPQLSPLRPTPSAVAASARGSGFDRLLDALIQVRPSGEQDLLSGSDRNTGIAALSLEFALARTAIDRHDQAAFRLSLTRLDHWLGRLYADGPLLRERRDRLNKLAALPLVYQLPVAGSTLEQLQALQRSRQSGR